MTLADRIAEIEARANSVHPSPKGFVPYSTDDVPALCAALSLACEALEGLTRQAPECPHAFEPLCRWCRARAALASVERIIGGGK
jgi:hypothetical protein